MKYLRNIFKLSQALIKSPNTFTKVVNVTPWITEGYDFLKVKSNINENLNENLINDNPLLEYFKMHQSGNGIEKWNHYFEIYHRHFSKFIGKSVDVMEIGIYSGGSLEMWRDYFGEKSHIYGVDIEEACRVYENGHTSIFIGDQAVS